MTDWPAPEVLAQGSSALLLDVDDTLVDTRAAMVEAGTAAVAALWPEAGSEAHARGGVVFHGDPRGYFERFVTGEMTFAEVRAARVAAMLEELGLDPVDDQVARFERAYAPAHARCLRAFPDVRPALDELAAAGVRIGALTNSDGAATERKLELTGLADDFTMIVTTDSLGFGKPDPRVFEHACELLGSDPAETVYVGDHVEIDALGATKAGLVGVWLRRSDGTGERGREHRGAADDELARAHGIPVIASLSALPGLFGTTTRHER